MSADRTRLRDFLLLHADDAVPAEHTDMVSPRADQGEELFSVGLLQTTIMTALVRHAPEPGLVRPFAFMSKNFGRGGAFWELVHVGYITRMNDIVNVVPRKK